MEAITPETEEKANIAVKQAGKESKITPEIKEKVKIAVRQMMHINGLDCRAVRCTVMHYVIKRLGNVKRGISSKSITF